MLCVLEPCYHVNMASGDTYVRTYAACILGCLAVLTACNEGVMLRDYSESLLILYVANMFILCTSKLAE